MPSGTNATLPPTLEELPELMTVMEAASYLRVGRDATYELCRQWFASSGAAGLPAIKIGRKIRIPRAALGRYVEIDANTTDVA